MRKKIFISFVFYFGSLNGFAQADMIRLSLQDFLGRVQVDSLDIKLGAAALDEYDAKSVGYRLPPPMLGLMNMQDSSGSNRGIEISQELPFPSKVFIENKLRTAELDSQAVAFSVRKREVILQAKRAYFEFWRAYNLRNIVDEKYNWLKAHVRLSRSIARADSASQLHLLATESELDQLENESFEKEAILKEKVVQLRLYVPNLKTMDIIPVSLAANEPVVWSGQAENPTLAFKKKELQTFELSQDLKRQSYWPDLFLRYRSYNGNAMTAKNEEVMLGFTLPFLFFWQSRADVAEARARLRQAEIEVEKTSLDQEVTIQSILEKAKSQQQKLTFIKDRLLPRAQKRMKLLESLTVRNLESLDEHRMVTFDYFDLKQKEVDSRFDLESLRIDLQKFELQNGDGL